MYTGKRGKIYDEFDPDDLTKNQLEQFADHLDNYLEMFQDVMVIPKELLDKEKEMDIAIGLVKELISKLKKGKKSVFKDMDE